MIIFLESLGCSRNQVDSEIMLGKLVAKGHTLTSDPSLAQVIIVNTCTFISTASDEAVDTILEMAGYKKTGACERLIATGCLAQRYKDDDLVSTLPEVDAFLGTGACDRIVQAVEGKTVEPLTLFPDPNQRSFQDLTEKRQLADEIFAYIKVSEGCNQKCTYCIIPKLRGTQRSRPVEDICKEGKILVSQGIKEIILTAENTTDYGQDLNDGTGFETVLFSLSDTLNQMPNKSPVWIRYLYTHPVTLSKAVINVTASFKNICSYYDVPVQHASSSILKKMGRPYTTEDLYDLFKTIRELDPDASLRTTIIAGFPGETDQDFDILMKFIEDIGFDHLGVFTYSDSTDLPSHCLKDHVPEQIAEQRYDQLMAAQARISERVNQRHVGRIYDVLVEEHPEPGVYIGRTMFQAPEVDGMTFIYAEELEINTIVRVRITDAYEYDIAGELA
ncbi:MAG: 30S ribosomal protein S12 methylthiotransferase RimO [Proteobacteria bacterium]|nr:30S ribosomal protein S12 methylthiotransferase RimO [Pseudomonadota bacterium]MBU1388269.1 30S ribosomal protein S12 methylthiotransferase RimO [Pseudomonadota bacterium]MBU1541842.1 30S ribosomal protein S12 methylthiotransferase RimO [Pseudomonadota bacterium]MBU2481523.1 30S ribosomal protein S12 methylthiotransferase RimO [Pseudomonadota bacterium]